MYRPALLFLFLLFSCFAFAQNDTAKIPARTDSLSAAPVHPDTLAVYPPPDTGIASWYGNKW
ncbi:MAG TPA: hypothetical protein VFU15_10095, partial [Bacteroidia bacterium]|nr:hypothetical protein [Bacteroidia bacterium]